MLYEALCDAAARSPAAGVKQNGVFTPYPAIAERAGRIATGLIDRGLEPGTPIGLMLPNGPELFTLAYAAFAAGCITVPLNAHAPLAELTGTARKSRIGALFASSTTAESATRLATELGGVPLFISGGTDANAVDTLATKPAGTLPSLAPDTPALYMFSSGSTGLPKVVPHTHGELEIDGRNATLREQRMPGDIQINMLPGSHAMGFLNAMYMAIAGGTTLYWSDPQPFMLSKSRFAQAIADEKVTILMGVPFIFDALSTLRDDVDLSSIRTTQSAGVALRGETYQRFKERFGIKLRQGYGSTECLAIATNTEPDPDVCWDSVGRPLPGLDWWIEPAENPFGPEFGELVVSAPWVTRGYLDAAATNATTIRDGRFYTGDLAGFGDDGCLYIKGRTKLLIETAGHKVDPHEIEEVLLQHPAVAEVVVVGIPDARTGEQRLKAVIVRSAEESGDALIRFCRERLASQKIPGIVEFRDELPRSAAGKILRGQLMEPV